MRIAVDVRELRRGAPTGIGRYVRGFLRAAERRRAEHSFILYGDRRTDFDAFPWAERVVLRAPWPLADHVGLSLRLRRAGADLFFSPYYKAPWRCPCPYVVTIHDLMHAGPLKLRAAAYFASRAAAVVTVSEASKADIVRRLGLAPESIKVVPNSVPPGFAPVDERARAEALGRLRLEPGFVLFVGGFKASKNPGALVDAYAALPEQARRAHPLVLAGPSGPDHDRFRRSGGARVLLDAPDADLAALYSSCAVCVVPSLHEGFGMPALEAMACGAPVLVSDREALPEVVADAGEISSPQAPALARALSRLLDDPERRAELSRRALERARRFDPGKLDDELFSTVLSAARRA